MININLINLNTNSAKVEDRERADSNLKKTKVTKFPSPSMDYVSWDQATSTTQPTISVCSQR